MRKKLFLALLPLLLSLLLCAYDTPAFLDSGFHADLSEGDAAIRLDLSALREGYVAVSAVSASRMKFQVIKDKETYTYNLASDGSPVVYPLNMGNGEYRFRVMENVTEKKYAERYSASAQVTMQDEFQPFLRPNIYVNYTQDSLCVQKAADLAANAEDVFGFISAVYEEICSTVTYDAEKASNVRTGYLPDPDETLLSGKGICFDYASLAAAMLRSQGVPTKEIFGYVSPNGLYHAWNMFYTEETGWVAVSFEVGGESWNRMDLTFSANGADASFIGDGANYTDLYFY